jgi:transcriptional regulator with XRE-family HTH domain
VGQSHHTKKTEKTIMAISPAQIRAARAMKNWNQKDLALKAGLAVPTIANIETSKQKPSIRTLKKIQAIFEKEDIEFTANDGLRKKRGNVRIFRGPKEYKQFFNFVYNHARSYGGSIYLSNVDEQYYVRWWPEFYNSEYVKNMIKIKDQFDFRILVKEGDTHFSAREYVTYRWMPASQFAPIPFEVFGDYLAIKLFLDEPIIFLIKNKKTADLYREKFIRLWENSIIIPEHILQQTRAKTKI